MPTKSDWVIPKALYMVHYYYPSAGQALCHSFMRGSHLLPSQLPGEHTGHKAASRHSEPIWNAHVYTWAWGLWVLELQFISHYNLKPLLQIFSIHSNVNLPSHKNFLCFFLGNYDLKMSKCYWLIWLLLSYTTIASYTGALQITVSNVEEN